MDLKEFDYCFGLNKEQLKFLKKSKKDGDFYIVGFADGVEKRINKKG